MNKFLFSIALLIVCVTSGCANTNLHQSLLLHENRQLEDALYTAHAQLADLKRENNSLRIHSSEYQNVPIHNNRDVWENEQELFPPFEMPRIILPDESGTTELPALLRETQAMPIWSPVR